ncbi:FimV family protein [Crenothrix sp.]|uniref:type IV pilus assembly protein FimV n=1 Tax=Crenothrix sp. TaxID=3100433 RepID=UPI00374D9D8A
MITTDHLLSCQKDDSALAGLDAYEIAFLLTKTPQQLNLQWLSTHPELLNFLVAGISKQPRNLVTHVQRICLCYQRNLSEHLYGAMVDLFTVLEGYANDFCGRLLDKVLHKLSPSHAYLLNQYLDDKDIEVLYTVQNSFVVLGKGLLGTAQFITKVAEQQDTHVAMINDPLVLARDYIEYSQFQEAKAVLESAILEAPTRSELHLDLLELYKSLQDIKGFLITSEALAQQGNPFPELWSELNEYFSARKML